jgi:hypothetical protein
MTEPRVDLESHLPHAARAWVASIPCDDRTALADAYSRAARIVGKAPVEVPERGTWGTDEIARAALLVRAGPERFAPMDAWSRGDNRERQAVLKALPLLPSPAHFLDLAVEACRSNVLTVFAAIACENPYPERYFPEASFNQMVLKAAFNGMALARIRGLSARSNAELARMADDFAAERRAAGRTVPEDLDLVTKGARA